VDSGVTGEIYFQTPFGNNYAKAKGHSKQQEPLFAQFYLLMTSTPSVDNAELAVFRISIDNSYVPRKVSVCLDTNGTTCEYDTSEVQDKFIRKVYLADGYVDAFVTVNTKTQIVVDVGMF
jgi:hypothetical protein